MTTTVRELVNRSIATAGLSSSIEDVEGEIFAVGHEEFSSAYAEWKRRYSSVTADEPSLNTELAYDADIIRDMMYILSARILLRFNAPPSVDLKMQSMSSEDQLAAKLGSSVVKPKTMFLFTDRRFGYDETSET